MPSKGFYLLLFFVLFFHLINSDVFYVFIDISLFSLLCSESDLIALLDELNAASKPIVVACIRTNRDDNVKAAKPAIGSTPVINASTDKSIVEGVHL